MPERLRKPIIALLTDFGMADPYVGMMKAAILEICPDASIIDLTHEIEAQSIRQGAFLLEVSLARLPARAVVVAVVDPGVGGARRPLAIQIGSRWLVGPDNGLFSRVWSASDSGERSAYELNHAKYWRPAVSDTFHGRDIFAPVAAHLAEGVAIDRMASRADDIELLPNLDREETAGGGRRLTIEHIDRFGNLITNLPAADVPEDRERLRFQAGTAIATGVRSHYAQSDRLIAVVGGLGYLELAAPNRSAAALTGAGIGDSVIMSSPPS